MRETGNQVPDKLVPGITALRIFQSRWLGVLGFHGDCYRLQELCLKSHSPLPQSTHWIDLEVVYTVYKLICHFSFDFLFSPILIVPRDLNLNLWPIVLSFSLSFTQAGFSLVGQVRERCGVSACPHVFACVPLECLYLLCRDIPAQTTGLRPTSEELRGFLAGLSPDVSQGMKRLKFSCI